MHIWVTIGIILFLYLSGIGYKLLSISKINKRIDFILESNNKFIQLMNGFATHSPLNQDLYVWLSERANAIQRELGSNGLIEYFQDPLKGIQGRDYQLFINTLPEIREFSYDQSNIILRNRIVNSAGMCSDMFLRHIGDLKELLKIERKKLANPFDCISDTTKLIITFPLLILMSIGLFSKRFFFIIFNSYFIKFINALVVLAGFISALMTIVLGWDGFFSIIKNLF